MTIRLATLALLLIAICPARSQVVETRHGAVEFIGLRSWEAARLVDSLLVLNSLDSLEAIRRNPYSRERPVANPYLWGRHLRFHFGFPEEHVVRYSDSTGAEYWVITVVEPADSLKIRSHPDPTRRPAPSEPEWRGLDTVPLWKPEQWKLATSSYGFIAAGKVDEGRAAIRAHLEVWNRSIEGNGIRPEEIEEIWLRISHITRPDHKKLALQSLATDSSTHNRAVAAIVLSNFSHDDRVWNALMSAQLDQWWLVSATARRSLVGLVEHLPRPIDWNASTDVIAAILDGSNLEGLVELLDVLTATEISPMLAPYILPGHEELLLAYLAASHERERTSAHRFLVRLAGSDLGSDPAIWRKWIADLGRGANR